jgi:hypothetical protein
MKDRINTLRRQQRIVTKPDQRPIARRPRCVVVRCDMCGEKCTAERLPDRTDKPCLIHGWPEREFVLCGKCWKEMPDLVEAGHGTHNSATSPNPVASQEVQP